MDNFLNNKRKSSASTGNEPSPQPSPDGRGGISLAVLQFVALARGEWKVQAERSPFRVERVFAEERYCLNCCGVRVHDVVEGQRLAVGFTLAGTRQQLAICRCCGCTGEVCEL